MANSKNKGFLANLLRGQGKGNEADAIEAQLKKLGQLLDKAQVAQKNIGKGRVTKGVLEDTRENMRKVLTRLSDNVDEGLLDELLALAVAGLSSPSTEADDAIEYDEIDDIMLEDEEMMDEDEDEDEEKADYDEDDEEEKRRRRKEFVATQKSIGAIAKAVNEQNAMLNGLVGELVRMAETVSALAPLAQKAEMLSALQADVKGIKQKMSSASRRASQADETRVDDKVAETLKSQGVILDPKWRVPVYGDNNE